MSVSRKINSIVRKRHKETPEQGNGDYKWLGTNNLRIINIRLGEIFKSDFNKLSTRFARKGIR